MLNHVDPTQVEVFRDALAVKFANGAIGLIEPAPPTQEQRRRRNLIQLHRPSYTAIDVQVATLAGTRTDRTGATARHRERTEQVAAAELALAC